jgi:hypothetical protein
MPYLIVESDYDPPLGDDELMRMSQALVPCLEVRGIRKLRSWVAEDRRRVICEFHATDTESVRQAYHSAQVAFARVWRATLLEECGVPDDG